MMCCGAKPIRNFALGKEFFVCMECKKEVVPETTKEDSNKDVAGWPDWTKILVKQFLTIGRNT